MTTSRRYVPVTVTVPASTPIATPVIVNPALGNVWLYAIQLRIPAGHAGFTGISVQDNTVSLVPWAPGPAWIIGDDERLDFTVNAEQDTGLSIQAYNLDLIQHSFYLRFECIPVTVVTVPAETPIVAVS